MKNYVKFISSLLLFGSNGVVAAFIALSSTEIVVMRTLIGAAMLGVCVALRSKVRTLMTRRDFVFVVVSGASMGISWLFLYEAYREVGVGVSSLAYYCAPVLVMALSPLLFKERLTPRVLISFAVVLAGAVLVNGATLETGGSVWGMTCGWASALAHAAMVIFSKKADGVDGLVSSFIQLVVSFVVAFAFLLVTSGVSFAIDASSWPWIIMLGLLNTGFGCYLYFSSIAALPAQTVAVLGYLEPLSAVICALIFLGEPMSVTQGIGACFIIAGAAAGVIKRRPSKTQHRVP